MSTGERMPLEVADRISSQLLKRWELDPRTCFVVGSVRRRCPMVGDIEIVAPLPKGKVVFFEDDPIFSRINATMVNPHVEAGELWTTVLASEKAGKCIGAAIRGLKPGFKAASLEVTLNSGHVVYVQVYRYTPENFGWMMIERTGTGGPKGFGAYFLECWKKRYGIKLGPETPASVNNHLVNAAGDVVPVPTEEEAFRLCGFKEPVAPDRRETFADSVWRGRAGG